MIYTNPLLDKDFLKQLDQHNNKTVYIRITALNQQEIPVEQIEGKATGGNINIQGNSAVRRTCSITLAVLDTETEITDVYWAFKNKFKLEIGLKNEINSNYPDIVWFKQGIFVVNNFSKRRGTTNLNISISGQDKMCLLNGTLGGALPHETDFGTLETEDENGNILIKKIPIYDIIKNAILTYAQERPENIVINVDSIGYELLEYRGDTPMYLLLDSSNNKKIYNNVFIENIKDIIGEEYSISEEEKIENEKPLFKYYSLNTLDLEYNSNADHSEYNSGAYVAKIEYGETAGYHQIPLVYNDDLILKIGEPITSMLDKIKNMLGNYEYFYDVDGRFIFQKKKTYVQELFNPMNGEPNTPLATATPYSYRFDDYKLFTAISNSPKVNNIKNDYSVWGTRKSINGSNLPIHVRYAIDNKPLRYESLAWKDAETKEEIVSGNVVYATFQYKLQNTIDGGKDVKRRDYRELIYQMALDYLQFGEHKDYLNMLKKYNSKLVKNGKTGYEPYYIDLQGYWRQLYNPNVIYDELTGQEFYDENGYDNSGSKAFWNKKIHTDPNGLVFWFELLDLNNYNDYSVKKIGLRTKTDNQNTTTGIFYKDTPEALFVYNGETIKNVDNTYTPLQLNQNMEDLFSRSAQGVSAIQRFNDLLYEHTSLNETLSITSIPIYYLQPNTRIYVEGEGDCTLDSITYQLTHNGTMNLNCTKIIKPFNI